MPDKVNYNTIAKNYDQRYNLNACPGIQKVLLAHVSSVKPWRVLEVGCGTGYWLEVLKEAGCIVSGLDASEGMLALARSRLGDVDLRHGTAETLPWSESYFQLAFMVNALHHFSDPYQSIQEGVRVLEPGGALVIIGMDPYMEGQDWFVYEYFPETLPLDRKRYPKTAQIRKWMSAAGLAKCKTYEAEHFYSHTEAREVIEQGQIERSYTSQLTLLAEDEYEQYKRRLLAAIEAKEAKGERLELRTDIRLYATEGFKPETKVGDKKSKVFGQPK